MQVTERRRRNGAADGESIEFGQIACLRSALSERSGNPTHGILGDVFIQGSRLGTSRQDAFDSLVLEGSVQGRMSQGTVQVRGIVTLTQQ